MHSILNKLHDLCTSLVPKRTAKVADVSIKTTTADTDDESQAGQAKSSKHSALSLPVRLSISLKYCRVL